MDVFQRVQQRAGLLMLARGDLDAAEELINHTPGLTEDERAALWLWCWSMLDPDVQRTKAREHIEAIRNLA